MCREYNGYRQNLQAAVNTIDTGAELKGNWIDGKSIPFLQGKQNPVIFFQFHADSNQAGYPTELQIHTADQSSAVETRLEICINGELQQTRLPRGLGIQEHDPAHLAFPCSVQIQFPAGIVKEGINELEIRICNEGWFTWDALCLTVVK